MWRNTTVKSRLTLNRSLLLLLVIAVQSPMMTETGIAQLPGPQASSSTSSGTGSVSPGAKSAAVSQGQGPIVLPNDISELRVEPGDLLSVAVYDTPELSNAYRVDPAGDLTLPLCGKVKVRGLTSSDVAKLLEATLTQDQILTRPQVNVDVLQYAGQYVSVLGEVNSPGRLTLIAPTKLSEILAQAGGVTSMAGTRIKIRRGAEDAGPEEDVPFSRSETNRETGSILVRPGDTIVVPRAGIIYVLGAVTRPGGYLMQEDGKLNVAEALALSGGTLLLAKTGGLRVIRRNADGTVLDFALSYDGIAKGSQTPLELQAQDIVYVPMSKAKIFGTTGISIVEQATLATVYATGVK
jgi:polysaccharide export outer membrane protein